MQNATALKLFEQSLKQRGYSNTVVRRKLFLVILKSDKPLTIQELIDKVNDVHFVSIYRAIDVCIRAGVIKQVPIGFKNMYEVSDDFKPHHHHVTCERCGRQIAIQEDEIEKMLNTITISVGMQPTSHHFEAYGVCSRCLS